MRAEPLLHVDEVAADLLAEFFTLHHRHLLRGVECEPVVDGVVTSASFAPQIGGANAIIPDP